MKSLFRLQHVIPKLTLDDIFNAFSNKMISMNEAMNLLDDIPYEELNSAVLKVDSQLFHLEGFPQNCRQLILRYFLQPMNVRHFVAWKYLNSREVYALVSIQRNGLDKFPKTSQLIIMEQLCRLFQDKDFLNEEFTSFLVSLPLSSDQKLPEQLSLTLVLNSSAENLFLNALIKLVFSLQERELDWKGVFLFWISPLSKEVLLVLLGKLYIALSETLLYPHYEIFRCLVQTRLLEVQEIIETSLNSLLQYERPNLSMAATVLHSPEKVLPEFCQTVFQIITIAQDQEHSWALVNSWIHCPNFFCLWDIIGNQQLQYRTPKEAVALLSIILKFLTGMKCFPNEIKQFIEIATRKRHNFSRLQSTLLSFKSNSLLTASEFLDEITLADPNFSLLEHVDHSASIKVMQLIEGHFKISNIQDFFNKNTVVIIRRAILFIFQDPPKKLDSFSTFLRALYKYSTSSIALQWFGSLPESVPSEATQLSFNIFALYYLHYKSNYHWPNFLRYLEMLIHQYKISMEETTKMLNSLISMIKEAITSFEEGDNKFHFFLMKPILADVIIFSNTLIQHQSPLEVRSNSPTLLSLVNVVLESAKGDLHLELFLDIIELSSFAIVDSTNLKERYHFLLVLLEGSFLVDFSKCVQKSSPQIPSKRVTSLVAFLEIILADLVHFYQDTNDLNQPFLNEGPLLFCFLGLTAIAIDITDREMSSNIFRTLAVMLEESSRSRDCLQMECHQTEPAFKAVCGSLALVISKEGSLPKQVNSILHFLGSVSTIKRTLIILYENSVIQNCILLAEKISGSNEIFHLEITVNISLLFQLLASNMSQISVAIHENPDPFISLFHYLIHAIKPCLAYLSSCPFVLTEECIIPGNKMVDLVFHRIENAVQALRDFVQTSEFKPFATVGDEMMKDLAHSVVTLLRSKFFWINVGRSITLEVLGDIFILTVNGLCKNEEFCQIFYEEPTVIEELFRGMMKLPVVKLTLALSFINEPLQYLLRMDTVQPTLKQVIQRILSCKYFNLFLSRLPPQGRPLVELVTLKQPLS